MVLVYTEAHDGQFKKPALEAVTYGNKTAAAMGTKCVALVLGAAENAASLGQYGATEVITVNAANLAHFDSQSYSQAISEVAQKSGAQVIILPHNSTGKSLAGRVAVRLNAGCVSAANSVPSVDGGTFKVKKNVFSGKAIAEYEIKSAVKVLTLSGNSVQPETGGADATVTAMEVDVTAGKVNVTNVNMQQGDVAPLPEAELVVSAGRGMKGPENWGIIEDLANSIGATTACSRPVADIGWRPHHEHVGQTGVAIKPNLYIAAGISGAIQHLA